MIWPQNLQIRTDVLHILNDFQKLMGDINWLRPSLQLSTANLSPLFDILCGDPSLASPQQLTTQARAAL